MASDPSSGLVGCWPDGSWSCGMGIHGYLSLSCSVGSSFVNQKAANYSCPLDWSIPCTNSNNMGWRYLFYTCGALVFVLSIARVLVIRFHETQSFFYVKGMTKQLLRRSKILPRSIIEYAI
jgi:hypothetical protein